MGVNWYALRSKPRKEESAWQHALNQGFTVYYPRLRVHPVNPRSRKLVPYFPGYLFVQADIEAVGISTFQWMPHTLGLVQFGGEPSTVPESLIQAIQKRVGEINQAGGEIYDGLKPGETVWINEGPFRGFEAIFDARLPGSERVRVLLEFLGNRRKVTVELDVSQIQRRSKK
ncbi:MAG: transcription termination/antitermination protein NusG [Chloroflexota bacterium]